MNELFARAVFYVEDGERALAFYRDSLGCSLDWNYAPDGRPFVFQVNMLGAQLILNEVEDRTKERNWITFWLPANERKALEIGQMWP